MPRLPDDSPLLYPENTGDYAYDDFYLTFDTCSDCLDDEDESFKYVIMRMMVAIYGTSETCNTICAKHLKEHGLDKRGRPLED